jgi:hypothetical protein
LSIQLASYIILDPLCQEYYYKYFLSSYILGLGIFVMDPSKEYALESFDAMVEKADRLDLALCLENLFLKAHSLANPEVLADIFAKLPNLKMTKV